MSDAVTIFVFWLMVLGPSLMAMHTNTRPDLNAGRGPLRRSQKKSPRAGAVRD